MSSKIKNSNRSLLWKRILAVSILINIFLVLVLTLDGRPQEILVYSTVGVEGTATVLVAQATQRMLTATHVTRVSPTPFPTQTLVEEIALREKWLSELEAELGFSHSVLEMAVDEYIESITMVIHSANNNYSPPPPIPDSIVKDIESIIFEDVNYVAVVIPHEFSFISSKVFIFRVENDVPELILDSFDISWIEVADLYPITYGKDNTAPKGFADRNGNGFPDISISFVKNGNPRSFMRLYEIRPNGEFYNLIQDSNIRIQYLVDFENDGIWEIQGFQEFYVPEGSRYHSSHDVPRWLWWNGESYEAFPLFDDD